MADVDAIRDFLQKRHEDSCDWKFECCPSQFCSPLAGNEPADILARLSSILQLIVDSKSRPSMKTSISFSWTSNDLEQTPSWLGCLLGKKASTITKFLIFDEKSRAKALEILSGLQVTSFSVLAGNHTACDTFSISVALAIFGWQWQQQSVHSLCCRSCGRSFGLENFMRSDDNRVLNPSEQHRSWCLYARSPLGNNNNEEPDVNSHSGASVCLRALTLSDSSLGHRVLSQSKDEKTSEATFKRARRLLSEAI